MHSFIVGFPHIISRVNAHLPVNYSSATARLHAGLPVRCAMRYPQAATTSRRCAALNRSRIAAGKCGNFNPCTRINASNFKRNWNEAVNRGTRHRTPSSERIYHHLCYQVALCRTMSHYVALCGKSSHPRRCDRRSWPSWQ